MPEYYGNFFCMLQVSDLERSIAWYQDILGAKVVPGTLFEWDHFRDPGEKMHYVELQLDYFQGCYITLLRTGLKGAWGNGLALGVFDMKAARQELEAKGVRFMAPTKRLSPAKVATFFDPDDNLITFYQDVEGPGMPPGYRPSELPPPPRSR